MRTRRWISLRIRCAWQKIRNWNETSRLERGSILYYDLTWIDEVEIHHKDFAPFKETVVVIGEDCDVRQEIPKDLKPLTTDHSRMLLKLNRVNITNMTKTAVATNFLRKRKEEQEHVWNLLRDEAPPVYKWYSHWLLVSVQHAAWDTESGLDIDRYVVLFLIPGSPSDSFTKGCLISWK